MDLRSGHPYWLMKNGILESYPSLKHDEECEVAVIGGGITGALIAYHLGRENIATILLDKRDVGTGSTAASTAMLMYATDAELTDLIPKVGEANAVRSYRLGLEAVGKLERLIGQFGADCGFERKSSLYLASKRTHVAKLRQEHELRVRHGFDVEFLNAKAVAERFRFQAPAAMLAAGDGQVDAYRLTHVLLRQATEAGARIFDRTAVKAIDGGGDSVTVTTEAGHTEKARRVVFATGYESQQYLKQKIGTLQSTFALVTEPVEPFPTWPERCLIWETNRPYYYLRSTGDGRIVVGGEDVAFATTHRQDGLIERKTKKLLARLDTLFPDHDFETAYAWAGTFGTTEDGLPYIGQTKEWPNAYFALGYGGNGITFSMIAADLIVDHYLNRGNADTDLFRFDR